MKGALTATSLPQAIELGDSLNSNCPLYILGGSGVYEEALQHPRCKHALITHLREHQQPMPCNVVFPSSTLLTAGFTMHDITNQSFELIKPLLTNKTRLVGDRLQDGDDLSYQIYLYTK